MEDDFKFEVLGTTLDDAVGEAYDKVARTLNLSYPGGPIIDKLAQLGNDTYELPRVMLEKDSLDFSFSGLKSAVINKVHNLNQKGLEVNVNDMATSFQTSVVDVLSAKVQMALLKYPVKQFVLAGGVAANKTLRKRLLDDLKDMEVLIPDFQYCTDNAAMIGSAAFRQLKFNNLNNDYIIKGFSTKQMINH